MGERAILDKGMETLENIEGSESTTFVLPQELTSLVGRYGKHLSGSDVQDREGLDSLEFDEATRELIGLDDVDELLGEIDVDVGDGAALADGDATTDGGTPADGTGNATEPEHERE
jgi:hypothetical protein